MDYGDSRGHRGGGGYGDGSGWGRSGGGGGGGWDNSGSYENGDSEVEVDHGLVGRIIGKGGCKIRELEETSGADIKVNSREIQNGKVRVVLTGSQESRSKAKDLIKDIENTFADMPRGGGGRGRYHGGGYGGGGGGYGGGGGGYGGGGGGYGGRRPITCYNCNEEGHMARVCPSGGGGGGGGGGYRY